MLVAGYVGLGFGAHVVIIGSNHDPLLILRRSGRLSFRPRLRLRVRIRVGRQD